HTKPNSKFATMTLPDTLQARKMISSNVAPTSKQRCSGTAAGGGKLSSRPFGIAVNSLLKLTLTIFVETRAALWGYLMTRVLGRGDGYQLRMIHNVRPAVELPGSSRWTALTITFGILMVSAALLLI